MTNVVVLLPITSYSQSSSSITSANNIIANNSSKIIILGFDDNRKGDFTYAKPILDKYGFKATFFIICGKTTDKGAMNWQDIAAMQRDGMDIESHTITHKHLNHLSANALNFEIAGSKQCLASHGYNITSFAYPYGEGADNTTVVKTVAKYYDLARTGSEPLMFLHCNGFKNHPQTDCRTYLPDGKLTYANRYAIRSLSFDRYETKDLFNNASIFSDFVTILNSQSNYNKANGITSLSGIVNNAAVPLITFHNVRPVSNVPYTTNVGVFAELMKYLHDNGYKVLDMANLRYDTKGNTLHIT